MCASGVAGSVKAGQRLKTTFGYTREKHLSRALYSVAIIDSNRDLNSTHIYEIDIR